MQHAVLAESSVKTALHNISFWISKSLESKQMALESFLDIEQVFEQALVPYELEQWLEWWGGLFSHIKSGALDLRNDDSISFTFVCVVYEICISLSRLNHSAQRSAYTLGEWKISKKQIGHGVIFR